MDVPCAGRRTSAAWTLRHEQPGQAPAAHADRGSAPTGAGHLDRLAGERVPAGAGGDHPRSVHRLPCAGMREPGSHHAGTAGRGTTRVRSVPPLPVPPVVSRPSWRRSFRVRLAGAPTVQTPAAASPTTRPTRDRSRPRGRGAVPRPPRAGCRPCADRPVTPARGGRVCLRELSGPGCHCPPGSACSRRP